MRTTARLGLFLTVVALSTSACVHGLSRNDTLIAGWQGRLDGHTVSYRIVVGCFCMGVGEWRVVERDGEVLEAEYLGDGEPDADRPAMTLSEGLEYASDADEVDFSDVSADGFHLSVDEDEDTMDDEFGFSVSDVVVED